MIDKYWLVKNGTFNPAQKKEDLLPEAEPKKWKNLRYFTLPFDFHFDNIDNAMIFADMAKQQAHTKQMVELYSKHEYYNKTISQKTILQYNNFYFFKGYYYKIEELKLWLVKKDGKDNTFVQTSRPTIQETPKTKKKVLTISRDAIRKITGYSPYVVPKWGTKQIYIEWQDVILQDSSPIILVDGSRQIGKSILYNEMVLLSNGEYKQADKLVVGNKLLSSNYKEQKITGLKNSKKQTYKITLENGITHKITAEHRLPLLHNYNPEIDKWDSNISTQSENYITAKELYTNFILNNKELDILKENRRKNGNRTNEDRKKQEFLQKKANVFLPLAFNYDKNLPSENIFNLTEQECLLIGYFIGDGTRGENTISGNHHRLLDIITEFGITAKKDTKSNSYKYSIFRFKQSLKEKIELKYFNELSYNKRLDSRLFTLPTPLKWKLVEGLLNTDAYISISSNKSTHIEYCSTSKELIRDMQSFLLQIGIISQKRSKKIKSNFKLSDREGGDIAYFLNITDRKSLQIINKNIDISSKLNYNDFILTINSDKISNGKTSLIPLETREYITNTSRQNKKPSYPFQRTKIETGHFKGIDNYLKYLWIKIKSIEFIEEKEEVITIKVDSDDELYFSNNVLTHNSLTIAEKAVELSFLPNEDTLVGGYIKKTTDVIRNYMLKFIRKFEDGIFIHFKSEGYILNTKSGTKIYFRTLDGDAENVLGLTLANIIVDESQLISTFVFEEVLEPTLATTNGRMILIGTPGKTAKGYYYDLIMEAKKGIEVAGIKIAVKSEADPDISYYQIDITQNPLVNPKLRKKVMENQGKAKNQRQWFCNWNSGEDQLFKPEQISEYPKFLQEGYFTITFDPARAGTDRSAFCVSYTYDGVVYIILSGFVPQSHKKKWTSQISYYTKGLIKQFTEYKNIAFGVDLRGIGEGFTEAFENHFRKPGTPKISLIKVGYTSGDTETINGMNWRVSKTRLISNAVDMMDEEVVKVLKSANKDLLEEFQFLYEDEDNKGRLAMKSTFKDDIANAFLVNLYIIHIKGYLKRSAQLNNTSEETFKDWNKDFENPKIKKRRNLTW